MPWTEVTRVSLREKFVQLAMQPSVNRREVVPALWHHAEDRLQVAGMLCCCGAKRSG
jgi:hypothetical protein